ncbi:sporulation integral membrane protein YtvI [Extibacter muris]|uniref:sporulation integral membrane protein YtvI n=1 Tax=Extibacter muris TaxID=1796622 RepID=UPI001D09651A|nr:sporulation integral membrane protein YtvI [Extibacter muris]MCB6200957.1 sporulation integral membrane protein YtvI [Extibacter muris]MCQ4662287.1 sporulation integral membrane protein YtvI [Extibacter muris]MCQ4691799.1 sporulation integral membrane protein YtvI [Extibacter muris]
MKTDFKEQLHDERPYWKVIVSLAFSLIGTALFVFLGARLLVFFMPFVIGWFIAYIASPVVNWLERRLKIVKKLGSAIIIIGVLAGLVFLLYFAGSRLWREIMALIQNMPDLYRQLESGLGDIGKTLEGVFTVLPKGIQNGWHAMVSNLDSTMGDLIGRFSEPTVAAAGNFAKKIPSVLIATIVTVISAYFFIADRDAVIAWSKKIAPDPVVRRMSMVIDNLKYAVGGYFKAQMKIMAVVFGLLLIGFVLMGVHFQILLALLIAFLDFLPFFGTGTALIPWALYKFMVGNYKLAIALMVLYAVTQLVRQLIQPKLVGDSMGLNPLVTLVLLYVGYKVGSVLGMIFAVPIGMIVINLFQAGAFDYILDDVKILLEGVTRLRNE